MTQRVLVIIFFLSLSCEFFGQSSTQSKGKVLAVDTISNKTSARGDTLSIKVKNLTPYDRGVIIEVVELSDESYYYDAVYSAYLNKDTSFFKKLRAAKKLSRKNNIEYVLPNYMTHNYDIKGNSETTISFMIKGKSIRNGVMFKLRITSDIVNGDFETIYSEPFKVFSVPD